MQGVRWACGELDVLSLPLWKVLLIGLALWHVEILKSSEFIANRFKDHLKAGTSLYPFSI